MMKKGYLIANIRVTDADKFQAFSGMAAPAIAQYGGKVLARGLGAHSTKHLTWHRDGD